MNRIQNNGEIYSVLYVDFDNIYTRLLEQDPSLARTFATHPQRWLRWLEGHALRMMYGDGVRRRILKRCCYLNPIRYHEFRPFFIRSAFQVVDCPPLTSHGKTSADIHLVMDCMDALAHETRFDEFIILSGDADFTPLLLRIQEYARRTLVLSVGYTSPAYAAACSWRIREDWFLSQALEEQREDGDSREERPASENREYRQRQNEDRDEAGYANSNKPERELKIKLPVSRRIRLVESIKQLVTESSVPVPLPSIAQFLQSEQEASPDWYGAGTLRELLEELDITPLVFSPSGQGYVFDPAVHKKADTGGTGDFYKKDPELYEFAQKIHRLVDLPLLNPQQYTALLSLLVQEVSANGFSRVGTTKRLEERSAGESLAISSGDISSVLEALAGSGFSLSDKRMTLKKVQQALVQRVIDQCKLLQFEMDEEEVELLQHWLAQSKI